MLSTPPAFVLSQNQTLRWKNRKVRQPDLKQRITHGGVRLKLTFLKPFDDYQINKYLVLVSVSITIYVVILLNKAHYWVLKQHTDSTPQLLVQEVSPLNGHSLYHRYRVPAATQSTIPAFCLPCKSDFRDSHHKVSFLNSFTSPENDQEFLQARNQNTIQLKVSQTAPD